MEMKDSQTNKVRHVAIGLIATIADAAEIPHEEVGNLLESLKSSPVPLTVQEYDGLEECAEAAISYIEGLLYPRR